MTRLSFSRSVRNTQNFYRFYEIFLFSPLYDFQIQGQVYRLIIQARCENQQPTCCQEGARTLGKVKIPKFQRQILIYIQKFVRNIIHHYNHNTLVVLELFTVSFYQFLFSRYLELAERHFSSDILVPFPNSGVLYSRDHMLTF